MMKKVYIVILIFLIFIICFTLVGSILITGDIKVAEEKDVFIVQKNKEVYFNGYGYDINNPNIIVNPYGNSPLTALVMFETPDYSEVLITIKGKNGGNDINYKFNKDKHHIIPIYGLYADYNNTVILRCNNTENILYINTSSLPEDFIYVNDNNDMLSFYNGNYPYAVDENGEVRWFLNSNYYGNIKLLENSTIIIGSDRYDEEGNTVSFYKMNLLGKIYNEYILEESYYGFADIYNGNILVLSDKILLIDSQTGKIMDEIIENDDYNYLAVSDDNVIVGKDNNFYKLVDNSLIEFEYSNSLYEYQFYNNTINYRIIPSSRFNELGKTLSSKKNINLFNYEKIEKLENIDLTMDVDRLKIVNNNEENIYIILDKFMDKKVYEVDDVKYVNITGLSGKYTLYFKIGKTIYKTDYFIEV